MFWGKITVFLFSSYFLQISLDFSLKICLRASVFLLECKYTHNVSFCSYVKESLQWGCWLNFQCFHMYKTTCNSINTKSWVFKVRENWIWVGLWVETRFTVAQAIFLDPLWLSCLHDIRSNCKRDIQTRFFSRKKIWWFSEGLLSFGFESTWGSCPNKPIWKTTCYLATGSLLKLFPLSEDIRWIWGHKYWLHIVCYKKTFRQEEDNTTYSTAHL